MSKMFKNINKKMLSIVLVFAIGFCVFDSNVLAQFGVKQNGVDIAPSPSAGPDTGQSGLWTNSKFYTDEYVVGVKISYVNERGLNLSGAGGNLVPLTYLKTEYYNMIQSSNYDVYVNYNQIQKKTTSLNNAQFTKVDSRTSKYFRNLDDLGDIGLVSSSTFSMSTFHDRIVEFVKTPSSITNKTNLASLFNLSLESRGSTVEITSESFCTEQEDKANGYNRNICKFVSNSEGVYEIFILYEPVMHVNANGKHYIGTVSELLNYFYKKNDSKALIEATGEGTNCLVEENGMGIDFCLLAEDMYNFGSCSSVLTNDLQSYLYNNTSWKLNFPSGSYFSNSPAKSLNVVYNSMYTLCKSNPKAGARKFLELLNNNPGSGGIGVGIVWPFEGDSGSVLNCDTINTTLGINHILTFEEAKNYTTQFTNLYSITPKEYCDTCGCTDNPPTPQKYNCTPAFSIGSCTTNTNTSYSDYNNANGDEESYWKNCVFNTDETTKIYDINNHKVSYSGNENDIMQMYDSNLSSKYCKTYCIEYSTATLSRVNSIKLAGTYFVPNDNVVSGYRTCRSETVDWNTFTNDLSIKKEVVKKAIDDYNNAKKFNDANGTWIKDRETGGGYSESDKVYGNIHCNDSNYPGTSNGCFEVNSMTHCKNNQYQLNPNTTPEESSGWCYKDDAKEVAKCNIYKWSVALANLNNSDLQISNEYSDCDTTTPSDLKYDLSNFDRAIQNAITKQNETINEMKKCYEWSDQNLYNLDSTATLLWNLGNYSYEESFDKNVVGNTIDNSTCVDEYVQVYDVNTKSLKNVVMKRCNNGVNKTRISSLTFSLKSNVYNYIMKGITYEDMFKVVYSSNTILPNKVINNTQVSSNYLNLGFGNLPIPFNISTGIYYDAYSLTYQNLGHKMNSNSTTALNSILYSIDSSNYDSWSCPLEVVNKLFGDEKCTSCSGPDDNTNPKGINIIYREIDLARPFPNIDNSNRDTGANWCSNSNCSWNNSVVERYILNNRNVTGSEVYNQTPMYTFIMRPDDILKIRKYNNSNSYESYTGADDSKTYDYKCNEGTGNACISDYLTHLLEILESYDNPGTCKDAKTRAYTDVTSFNNCRY